MNQGSTVFSQLLAYAPKREFRRCVSRYGGNRGVRTFSCADQFGCMVFAQLTYRESLRDIEACLRSLAAKLYHAGIRGNVSRSTLADANDNRDWRIYADFAQVLIGRARRLYANEPLAADLDQTVYALDATTIDLCLSLFPWARFQRTKGAVKLHTLLDLRGAIPSFIEITHGKVHDARILDQLIVEPGSIYVMDRGYIDFRRLWVLHQCLGIFIVRTRKDLKFRRLYSHPVDKSTGLLCDQTIVLTGVQTKHFYTKKLRRIRFRDPETQKAVTLVTNDFTLPAITVADLYRSRWQIELFFRWIKQHLRIKSFYGTSANAVKTQIWIAISVYVLVAIVKKQLRIDRELYTILQILSVTLFEKVDLYQVLAMSNYTSDNHSANNQLQLFTI